MSHSHRPPIMYIFIFQVHLIRRQIIPIIIGLSFSPNPHDSIQIVAFEYQISSRMSHILSIVSTIKVIAKPQVSSHIITVHSMVQSY